jgi:hypothetical protein
MYSRLLLLIVISHCNGLLAQSPVPYGDNAAAGHYLPARGFRLYYESYGRGEPLVLLHTNGAYRKIEGSGVFQ